MRRIILSEMTTLDGYVARRDGNIDWHIVDDDFNAYAIDLLERVDTILLGRKTYELFVQFWPTARDNPVMTPTDHIIADHLNAAGKIVFSRTLDHADWKDTTIHRSIDANELRRLKERPGKDLILYGSASIVPDFTKNGLIDEYHLFICPLILGDGLPLFDRMAMTDLPLALHGTRTFSTGVVAMNYMTRT